ncbi:MAG: nucleoside kinase, partial [Lachnospiraceae bacterium]
MNIILHGETKSYADGTSLFEISRDVAESYPHPIIVASVNGNLRELSKIPADGATVEFLTTASDVGNKTYIRGLILLFLKAVYTVFGGKGMIEKVRIEHSIGNG